MNKADWEAAAERAPALAREIIHHAIGLCEFPAEAAMILLVAAHAITRHYPTPPFDVLVQLVLAGAPTDVVDKGEN